MKETIPFIKVARSFKDHHLWLCEPFSRGQAWLDIIFLANYSEGFFYIRGTKIDIQRGEWAGSMEFLAERWKWSRTKVKSFLKVLQTEQQIILEITNIVTKLSIVNYDKFQDNSKKSTADCKAEIHQKYSRSTAEKHTQKKNKEEREEKEERKSTSTPEFLLNREPETSTDDDPIITLKIDKDEYSTHVKMKQSEGEKLRDYFTKSLGNDSNLARIKLWHYTTALEKWIVDDPKRKPKSCYLTIRAWFNKDLAMTKGI